MKAENKGRFHWKGTGRENTKMYRNVLRLRCKRCGFTFFITGPLEKVKVFQTATDGEERTIEGEVEKTVTEVVFLQRKKPKSEKQERGYILNALRNLADKMNYVLDILYKDEGVEEFKKLLAKLARENAKDTTELKLADRRFSIKYRDRGYVTWDEGEIARRLIVLAEFKQKGWLKARIREVLKEMEKEAKEKSLK